jgi:hypothetical protein
MTEKIIEVKANKEIRIEAVEGGLFFVSSLKPDGKTYGERTAATSAASLVKQINTLLGLEKKARKSRTPKAPAAQ